MLYDPKWNVLYTKENFAKWLAEQPADATYDYCKPMDCAAAQYLKAHGVEDCGLAPHELRDLGWHNIVLQAGGEDTFGAAAKRAKAELRTEQRWAFLSRFWRRAR
jgi:hypothetical protein